MPSTCPVEWVDSEHPLFLLYTSGSTGENRVLFNGDSELSGYGYMDVTVKILIEDKLHKTKNKMFSKVQALL
jgi:acyl-coenzyme A synthetase/AMP-(fatty) acid ligase